MFGQCGSYPASESRICISQCEILLTPFRPMAKSPSDKSRLTTLWLHWNLLDDEFLGGLPTNNVWSRDLKIFNSLVSRQLSTHLLVSGVTGQWWGQRQTLRAVTQAPMNLVTSDAGKTNRFDIGSETVQLVVGVHLASLLWGRGSEMERLRREWSRAAVTCGWHCWSPVGGAGGSGGGLTTCCWLRWRGLPASTPPGPPSHHPRHSRHPAHHQDTLPLRLPRHMILRCQPDCKDMLCVRIVKKN